MPQLLRDGLAPAYEEAGSGVPPVQLIIGRTVGSGHFSQIQVPDQVNAMLERFLEINCGRPGPEEMPV